MNTDNMNPSKNGMDAVARTAHDIQDAPASLNAAVVVIERAGRACAGTAWNNPSHDPGKKAPDVIAKIYDGMDRKAAARAAALEFAEFAGRRGVGSAVVFVDANIESLPKVERVGATDIVWGAVYNDGSDADPKDPIGIRARAARNIAEQALDQSEARRREEQRPMNVIVTAGPTNERIDAVMKITNMSTGVLGTRVAETMLNADGKHWRAAEQIGKLYYISPKLAHKPAVPDGQAYKLELVQIESAEDLLREIERICKAVPVDVIVHSCAVGDYKARYSARAEDVAAEISAHIQHLGKNPVAKDITEAALEVLKSPACAADDGTKMSSYESNLFTMMDLTPKVIGRMRDLAPRALIFGFKLLENVEKQHLFQVASALRQKNRVDYVIANDLSQIGNGRHPAMFVGADDIMERDAVFAECADKQGIADTICDIAFGKETQFVMDGGKKSYWQVIAANNMNTNVRVEGFSSDRHEAWNMMLGEFEKTVAEMLPDVTLPAYIGMREGFRYDDDGRRTANIGEGSASVYDGKDMWYWNLVPMGYEPAAQDGNDGKEACDGN